MRSFHFVHLVLLITACVIEAHKSLCCCKHEAICVAFEEECPHGCYLSDDNTCPYQYNCHCADGRMGVAGPAGAPGPAGPPGANGAPGTNCTITELAVGGGGDCDATGGFMFTCTSNGTVTSGFVCTGASGLSTDCSVTSLAPGATCTTGGFNYSCDFNGTVTSGFVCNGDPSICTVDVVAPGDACAMGGLNVTCIFNGTATSEVTCNGLPSNCTTTTFLAGLGGVCNDTGGSLIECTFNGTTTAAYVCNGFSPVCTGTILVPGAGGGCNDTGGIEVICTLNGTVTLDTDICNGFSSVCVSTVVAAGTGGSCNDTGGVETICTLNGTVISDEFVCNGYSSICTSTVLVAGAGGPCNDTGGVETICTVNGTVTSDSSVCNGYPSICTTTLVAPGGANICSATGGVEIICTVAGTIVSDEFLCNGESVTCNTTGIIGTTCFTLACFNNTDEIFTEVICNGSSCTVGTFNTTCANITCTDGSEEIICGTSTATITSSSDFSAAFLGISEGNVPTTTQGVIIGKGDSQPKSLPPDTVLLAGYGYLTPAPGTVTDFAVRVDVQVGSATTDGITFYFTIWTSPITAADGTSYLSSSSASPVVVPVTFTSGLTGGVYYASAAVNFTPGLTATEATVLSVVVTSNQTTAFFTTDNAFSEIAYTASFDYTHTP